MEEEEEVVMAAPSGDEKHVISSPSPRQRIKKHVSTRSEFPDSGPEMAKLRVSSLTAELLMDSVDRELLESELDWLERTHPTSVVLGMTATMLAEQEQSARLSSVFLKNFVSRIGRWPSVQEEVRGQTFSLLCEELKQSVPRSSNAARVIAAICEAEDPESQTRTVQALCQEASTGLRGACECLAFLGLSVSMVFRKEILTALCQGLFAVSMPTAADPIVLRALCDVLTAFGEDLDFSDGRSMSNQRGTTGQHCPVTLLPIELCRAACAFGARTCPIPELRARTLECFRFCWVEGHGVDAALLARTALEAIQLEGDMLVVERALEFWTFVASDPLVSSYLESVLNAVVLLLSKATIDFESEPVLRELLVALVSTSPDCADLLAFAFESNVEVDSPRERRLSLLAIGCLCHSAWLTREDGAKYSKLLTSAPFEEDMSNWVHPTARWALEQACLRSCDLFFASPNDFGRLITALVNMLGAARSFYLTDDPENDDPKESITCACRCLIGMLHHDREVAGGKLATPHEYHDELGRVPTLAGKTNRFSAYFSQLIEALSVCETEESNEAILLLIDNCANDVLGFVSWMLSRQIRMLWSWLTLTSSSCAPSLSGSGVLKVASGANTGVSLGGRKRLWSEDHNNNHHASTATFTGALSPSSASSTAAVVTVTLGQISSPQRQKASSRSLPFTCARLQACFERLSRAERDDPTLWKIGGEAGSVLLRVLNNSTSQSMPSNHRVSIMYCLRTICKTRGDLNLSSLVANELTEAEADEDDERMCAALGLCFTRHIAEDSSVIAMLKENVAKLELSVQVRAAALRALGEVIAERQRRGCCPDAASSQMCSAIWSVLNFTEDDELDTVWEFLDVSATCFTDYLSATASGLDAQKISDVVGRYISSFVSQRAARACATLPFHTKKTSVALKSLSLVAGVGQVLRRELLEPLFEAKYEEFGPVFDVVAAAVAGKDASGEAAQKAGKVASDALLLVFPRGSFE